MDRDELLSMLCVDLGAPIPDDVVGAGWTLILVYRDVAAWERASALARSADLPVIEGMSGPGGRGGTPELCFDLSAP